MGGDFLTPRERVMVDKLEYDRLHHGYWGKSMPFVWQRWLYRWRQGREEAAKTRYCKKHGHHPGVIWLIDGLPYPPHHDYMERWAVYGGNGILEYRGMCWHCWDIYTLPWPVKNPESELEAHVRDFYPDAIYLDLRKLSKNTMRELIDAELARLNEDPEHA